MQSRPWLIGIVGVAVIVAALLWWSLDFDPVPAVGETSSDPESSAQAGPIAGAGTGSGTATGDAASPVREARREQDGEAASEASLPPATKGALRVRVRYGDDQSPAAHIGVAFREINREGPRLPRRHTATDAKGEVRIPDLRPGLVIVWTDRKSGDYDRAQVVAGEETELVITLKDGIDVSGIVVDAAGRPVPAATIVLAGWAAMEPRTVGQADQRGRFSLRQIERMANIGARARGFAPSPLRGVNAGAGAELEIRVVMTAAGGSVHGQVLDHDRRPVADALVRLGVKPQPGRMIKLDDGADGMSAPQTEVRTDAEGQFIAEGLAVGKCPVTASTEQLAPWAGSIEVVAHASTPLTIQLTPAVTVVGTVRDETGEAQSGVEVAHGAYDSVARRSTRTASDGAYRLTGLAAGDIEIKVHSESHGNAIKTLAGRVGDTLRWDVTLTRGLVLAGVVKDATGKPLEHVGIEAIGSRPGEPWFRHVAAGKDGRFELIDCPTGPVIRLTLRRRGYEPLQRNGVDASSGPLALVMRYVGEPTARIVGRVLDPDGMPVVNATVSPHRRGKGSSPVSTISASGDICLEKLTPGTYSVSVRAGSFPTYRSASRELVQDQTWDLGTVQLQRGGQLRLEVPQPFAPKSGISLSIFEPGGRYVSSVDQRKQPYRSRPLAPGDYLLRISGAGVIPQSIPFVIRAGAETTQRATIRRGSPVMLEFGLPQEGAAAAWRLDFTLEGPDGFRFDYPITAYQESRFPPRKLGLANGRYTVRARTGQGQTGRLTFDVVESSIPLTLRIDLR